MATRDFKSFEGFELSTTFGTPYETDKDRAKRAIMEQMHPLITDDEVIVIDPDADMQALNTDPEKDIKEHWYGNR